MTDFLTFGAIGLGSGAMWALSAQGIVLVFRGSGVLNFAHGAISLAGAFVQWELQVARGWSFGPAFVVSVLAAAAIGATVHLAVMRPLRAASLLTRTVATLAVTGVVTSTLFLVWGDGYRALPSVFAPGQWHAGSVPIPSGRIYLLVVACVVTLVLWTLYRFTRFGLATTAIAESRRSAASLGLSPNVLAAANWALGSAVGAGAAVLVGSLHSLYPTEDGSLLLAPLAAALVGGLRSFPVAFAVGVAIGVTQAELAHYNQGPNHVIGLEAAVPFFVILLVLVLRGRTLPLRDLVPDRPPRVGTGRVDPWLVVPAVTAAALAIGFGLSPRWTDMLTLWLGAAIVLLSVVVVTGYSGQLSLAQNVLAGGGVLIALRLVGQYGLPLWLAVVLALPLMALLGAVLAIPAARARGMTLPVLTLGLGATTESMIYPNDLLTGGRYRPKYDGVPDLFGWSIQASVHSNRYALFSLGAFVVAALAAANVRQGRSGRRLLATRANERAAAALGISVAGAKIHGFALGAAIAALGGIVLTFRNSTVLVSELPASGSAQVVMLAMIGGVGYLLGPVLGAAFASGAIVAQLTSFARYLPLTTAAVLLVVLVWSRDGAADGLRRLVARAGSRLPVIPRPQRRPAVRSARATSALRVRPQELAVENLTVRYGAVVAVDGVSLSVAPGEVVGLIGPNGSGKTTLIDAVTGFVPLAGGSFTLGGRRLDLRTAVGRSRAGLSRSFQSFELFDDLSVRENLQAAADSRDLASYVLDVVAPRRSRLTGGVEATVEEFGLVEHLDRRAGDLDYGTRRLLAIARAVATGPSVLLLDEPAAGLSDPEVKRLGTLLRRLADDRGIGVLLVEHEVELVMAVCDSVVVLDFGRVIGRGTPEEIRQDPAVVAAYLGHPEE